MSAQRKDADGIVMPWFTFPALDEIASWDLKDKVILEWGGGMSTLWWAKRCKSVLAVEHVAEHPEWFVKLCGMTQDLPNAQVLQLDGDEYIDFPLINYQPDIIVVDGEPVKLRTACIEKAIEFARTRPITLIVDNWQQPGIYVDEHAVKLLSAFEGVVYAQPGYNVPGHTPWNTGIWKL